MTPGKAGKGGGLVRARSEEEAEWSTSPRAALSRGTGALVCRVEGWELGRGFAAFWGYSTVISSRWA